MIEPNTARYAKASQPSTGGMECSRSPVNALPTSNKTPAIIISAALAMAPGGSGKCRLHTEPKAQEAAANSSNMAPVGLDCRLEPMLSIAMPIIPSTTPAHSRRVLRAPQKYPHSKVNNGTVATASAATPEATPVCSATVTAPLPKVSSKMPILAAAYHCTHVGAGAPRQRKKPYIANPATKNRIPPSISGGQYSTPIRITR